MTHDGRLRLPCHFEKPFGVLSRFRHLLHPFMQPGLNNRYEKLPPQNAIHNAGAKVASSEVDILRLSIRMNVGILAHIYSGKREDRQCYITSRECEIFTLNFS